MEERTCALREWSETSGINRIENNGASVGVIASGAVYQYAREALGDSVNYLKLGMVYPLPDSLLLEFAAANETVYVIEELDDFIESHCKSLGMKVIGKDRFPRCGEFSQNLIRRLMDRPLPESVRLETEILAARR